MQETVLNGYVRDDAFADDVQAGQLKTAEAITKARAVIAEVTGG